MSKRDVLLPLITLLHPRQPLRLHTNTAQVRAPNRKSARPPSATKLTPLPLVPVERTVTTHFLSFLSSPFPSLTLSLFHLSISEYSGKLSVDETTIVTFSTSNRLALLVSCAESTGGGGQGCAPRERRLLMIWSEGRKRRRS